MLPVYIALAAATLIAAVLLRLFAEDHPRREDEPPDAGSDDGDPDLMVAA